MKYSVALFAGLAAASYIPAAPSSSSVAVPTSSAHGGYGYGESAPKSSSAPAVVPSSSKAYGGYWPEKSSSSVKAPVVSSKSSAPYKPTYTTFECDVSFDQKSYYSKHPLTESLGPNHLHLWQQDLLCYLQDLMGRRVH